MDSNSKPIVWGIGTARTIRPHWVLCELGIPYEIRPIIPRTASMHDSEFRARSTRGKVPIVEHGGLTLGESAATVLYFADRFRDRVALSPAPTTDERARFDEMCFFIMTELDGPLYVIRRHDGLPEVYGKSEIAVDSARQYFLRQTQVITEWLAAEGPYLMGENFCAADILLGSCESWARFIGIELPPQLAAHLSVASERDSFKQAFTNNFPPIALAELEKGRR